MRIKSNNIRMYINKQCVDDDTLLMNITEIIMNIWI
jgi:hypothetical protein